MAEEEGKHPSAYNSPVANLVRRISDEMKLPVLENENGGERYWDIIFLGKYTDDNLFSWKVRPELSEAMKVLGR